MTGDGCSMGWRFGKVLEVFGFGLGIILTIWCAGVSIRTENVNRGDSFVSSIWW